MDRSGSEIVLEGTDVLVATGRTPKTHGIGLDLAGVPAVLRRRTLSESRGFMKALVDATSDRILGLTVFGVESGEILPAVQVAMSAGLPYTALRDAIFTHPTRNEGLEALFATVPGTVVLVSPPPRSVTAVAAL